MLFRVYFNKAVFFLMLIMFGQHAVGAVYESKCGNDIFQIKILNGSDLYEMRYEVYYKSTKSKFQLIYKTATGVFFEAACIKDSKKQDVLLFQEHCFGNACPEDIYGVINVVTKKILIKPINWPKGNYKQTQKILGYAPPFLPNDNRTFCCNNDQCKKK